MSNLYFIAELGQNHQGRLDIAKKMIRALVGTGVNAVKTAKRDIDVCLSAEQKSMPYTGPHSFGKTYYEHRKALELSHKDFTALKEYAEDKGFDFISSFTDIPSFDFLLSIGLKKMKIASQRIIDEKLLKHAAKRFKGTMYLSSGMSDIEHIDRMIEIFKKNKKYLMQCTSEYPCPDKHLNLRTLKMYRERYKNIVNGFGFSGHNMSVAPDIVAYTLGARVIERHFTLNRHWMGGDHIGSLEVYGIKKLIKYLNQAGDSLGDSEKNILPGEYTAINKLRGDLV